MKKVSVSNARLIAAFAIGIAYAAAMVISAAIAKNDIHEYVHFYTLGGASLAVATALLLYTVKHRSRGLALYMALGMGCLAIGKIFEIVANAASYYTDPISVGYIAQICCYLFIIASFSSLAKIHPVLLKAVNIAAFFATAACAAAVILDSRLILIISIMVFDFISGGYALALFIRHKDKRFFAAVIMCMCVAGMLSAIPRLYIYPTVFSPLLGMLLVEATVRLDKEAAYA